MPGFAEGANTKAAKQGETLLRRYLFMCAERCYQIEEM